MSPFERAVCRSGPWRAVARRFVLPWALQGVQPGGDVLELGAGSGAMAAEVLGTHPTVRLTATDVDPLMVDTARRRLEPFGDRAVARVADATALPFDDGSFDLVLSWVMLHHTVGWETALSEAVRVLRPGGSLVGYDLLENAALRALHRGDGTHRFLGVSALREAAIRLPVSQVVLTSGLGGLAVRFILRKGEELEGAVPFQRASS
jgi:SAM-dependent methyltransferase